MQDWFNDLTCPATGARLRSERLEAEGMYLLHGPKHVFPVICGIPRLILDEARAAIVARLRSGDWEAATKIALSWPDKNLSNRVRRKLSKVLLRNLPGLAIAHQGAALLSTGTPLLNNSGSTQELLERLQSGFFVDWLIHRFCARTFKPLRALSRVLRPTDQVLDIGGGFGHGAWEICAHVPEGQITLVDEVFSHLFLAKTQMVPGIRAVAADLNNGVPFAGRSFDAIIMSDTFHFVDAQQQLVEDCERLLSTDGRIILSQIHNGLIGGEFTGNPRSPQGYMALFANLRTRLYRNRDLLSDLAEGAELRLNRQTDLPELEADAELSMVADRTGNVFTALGEPAKTPRNPRLSSLLMKSTDGGLTRRDTIHEIVQPFLDYPPQDLLSTLRHDDVMAAIVAKDCADLIRAGVVVDVPPNYFPPHS